MTREEGRTPSHVHLSASSLYVIAAKGDHRDSGRRQGRKRACGFVQSVFLSEDSWWEAQRCLHSWVHRKIKGKAIVMTPWLELVP